MKRSWHKIGVLCALFCWVAAVWAEEPAKEVNYTDPATNKQGGKASASSEPVPEEMAENAFKPGGQAKWLGNMIGKGAWLQYSFDGEGYTVARYRLISANDEPSRDPKTWKVLGSNDGKEWTTLDEQTDQTFDDRFEAKVYSIKEPKLYKIYRLSITANNGSTEDNLGGEGLVQVSEWQLLGAKPAGGDTILTDPEFNKEGGEASASSEPVPEEMAVNAFKIGAQGKWLGNMEAKGAWLMYSFKGQGYAASRYRIVSANDAAERDPKAWKLEGSNDGKEWTKLDERKDQTFADRFTANTYRIDAPAVYKMYRLAISENNGSTEDNLGGQGLIQLSELQLLK